MGRLKRRVLKFGGTSVGSVAPLRGALAIAGEAARARPVTVVVSALAGVTNALEAALAGLPPTGRTTRTPRRRSTCR